MTPGRSSARRRRRSRAYASAGTGGNRAMSSVEKTMLVVDDEPTVLGTVGDGSPLMATGFSTEVTVVHGVSPGDPLLVKPFSLETLARKVKELVEHRSPFSRPPQPPGR